MAGTVFVTGGSGFVGSAVIDELVSRGYAVRALVRGRPIPDRGGRVSPVSGDLHDPAALDRGMTGCEAVIHLVGIIMEKPAKGITFERIHFQGTQAVVDAAKRANIKRYVQMSAMGTRPDAVSDYHRTKWKAEEYVRASGLDWTIIRPSMIHGPKGEFMQMEAAWAKKKAMPYLFMPYFGKGATGFAGSGKLQPVYVGDVAKAFVDALEKPQTVGQTYDLGGTDVMDWPTMHRKVATILTGKPRLAMPIPAWYANALTYIAPAALLPFNRAQVQMAREDNTGDNAPLIRDFGWTPRGFEETVKEYAGQV
jgi:NADH dehydrogenase